MKSRHSGAVAKIQRVSYGKAQWEVVDEQSWTEVAKRIKKRDGNQCMHPGCQATVNLEAHHISRVGHGGTSTGANLLTLCERHHAARHSHLQTRVKPRAVNTEYHPQGKLALPKLSDLRKKRR